MRKCLLITRLYLKISVKPVESSARKCDNFIIIIIIIIIISSSSSSIGGGGGGGSSSSSSSSSSIGGGGGGSSSGSSSSSSSSSSIVSAHNPASDSVLYIIITLDCFYQTMISLHMPALNLINY